MASNFELPEKAKVESTVIELIRTKPMQRQDLMIRAAEKLGLSAEDLKDRSPNSKLTLYKSFIGTVISELVGEKLVFDEKSNCYTLPKPVVASGGKPAKKKNENTSTFEKISFEARNTYRKLVTETDKLMEKYEIELKKSLLKCLAVCSSEFFEEVSVKLVCLVYRVPFECGTVTGGADDEGIDGIVRIVDDLGYDKEVIYIQSKCRKNIDYVTTATEMRNFFGAASNKGAKKAVLITNGKFHDLALNEAKSNTVLKLVDGNTLADLMIKFRLGVLMIDGLPVIDEDFFPIKK